MFLLFILVTIPAYLQQKEEARLAQSATYERQQKEIAKQQEFIERFRASATRSTQAKSREKQLDKSRFSRCAYFSM